MKKTDDLAFYEVSCSWPHSNFLLIFFQVQHALKKSDSALQTLNKAIDSDPKNPLCKFHRASILFATDRHREALSELGELKQIVPKESLVYFLIGKVCVKSYGWISFILFNLMSQVLFLRSDRKLSRFVGSPPGVRSVYLNLHETEFYQLPSSQDLFKTVKQTWSYISWKQLYCTVQAFMRSLWLLESVTCSRFFFFFFFFKNKKKQKTLTCSRREDGLSFWHSVKPPLIHFCMRRCRFTSHRFPPGAQKARADSPGPDELLLGHGPRPERCQ